MARVGLSDGWAVVGDVPAAQATVRLFLRERGMRVVGEQAGEVHARQGWWPAGLLGSRLAPARWLPAKAVVRLARTADGVGVRARVDEASGARHLSPRLMDRYHTYCSRWMADLKAVLREAQTGRPSGPARPARPAPAADAAGPTVSPDAVPEPGRVLAGLRPT